MASFSLSTPGRQHVWTLPDYEHKCRTECRISCLQSKLAVHSPAQRESRVYAVPGSGRLRIISSIRGRHHCTLFPSFARDFGTPTRHWTIFAKHGHHMRCVPVSPAKRQRCERLGVSLTAVWGLKCSPKREQVVRSSSARIPPSIEAWKEALKSRLPPFLVHRSRIISAVH